MSLAQDIRNAYDWRDRDALEHALGRVEAMEAPKPRTDLVPGRMRCAKCSFELTRITLAVNLGRAIAGDNVTEPCPNGCGPLWPVTWEQEARSCWAGMETLLDRAVAAESALEQAKKVVSIR